MKRKIVIVLACCMALGLAACGSNSEETSGLQVETVAQQDAETAAEPAADADQGKETSQDAETAAEPAADANQATDTTQATDTAQGAITEEQALNAVRNYCFASQPDLKDMVNSDDYTIYWEVSTNDAGEIVVLYRSYTAALIRYYIDPATGDAYVTEQVPGIIDDEQKNGETLNIREYMD